MATQKRQTAKTAPRKSSGAKSTVRGAGAGKSTPRHPARAGQPTRGKKAGAGRKKTSAAKGRRQAAAGRSLASLAAGLVSGVSSRVIRLLRHPSARQFAGLALIVAGLFSFWVFGGIEATGRAIDQSARAGAIALGFTIDRVSVTGRGQTDLSQIDGALSVSAGASLLHVDLWEAKQRLESLPWVREAVVYRLLPSRLHIQLEERRPIARWSTPAGPYLVDADGEVIGPATASDLAALPPLLEIEGEGASEPSVALVSALRQRPEIAGRVFRVVRVGARRWDLVLVNGVVVAMPVERLSDTLDFLNRADTQAGFLDGEIRRVDLRRLWTDKTATVQLSSGFQERLRLSFEGEQPGLESSGGGN